MREMRDTSAVPSRWLSAHLYFSQDRAALYGEYADAIALDVVAPFVARCRERGWISRFFFIRYSDGSSHVRLRLEGSADVLSRCVGPALVDHVRSVSPGVVIDGDADLSSDHSTQVVALRWVPYEPETVRYGGPYALAVAETLFSASSDAALALLPAICAQPRRVRLGRALLAMLAIVHPHATRPADAITFFDAYHRQYLRFFAQNETARSWLDTKFREGVRGQEATLRPYVLEAWDRLTSSESISPSTDTLAAAAKAACTELRVLQDAGNLGVRPASADESRQLLVGIVASYVHMMNNRLGVRVDEEAYLAYACTEALGARVSAMSAQMAAKMAE
jgi:thiopeptide-type bacteriocin biosynthesis protein